MAFGKNEPNNVTDGLYILLTTFLSKWLLEIHSNTSKGISLSLSGLFTISVSLIFLIICLQSLMQKETSPIVTILYIKYFDFLLCNALHSVGNRYWSTFLRRFFIAISSKLNLLQ